MTAAPETFVPIPVSVEAVISTFLADLHLNADSRERLMAVIRNCAKHAAEAERRRVHHQLGAILAANVVWPESLAHKFYDLYHDLERGL